jgi:DNA-directed RNA polymerase I and III subunit RPAC2
MVWATVLLFISCISFLVAKLLNIDTTTAVEALEKGLDTVMDLCDVVSEKFTTTRDAFNASEADKMRS